jgi:phage recombination protein Bet
MSAVVLQTQAPRRSIVATMAAEYGMEPAAFEATIRATCMPMGKNEPPATREEFAAFAVVCNKYGLNPITREIYAMRQRGGGILPVVSVDGWLKKINEHPEFDGMTFEDIVNEKGALVAVTCRIYRKDRTHPTAITEYLDECVRDTSPWKMKHRMLRHKALIQCARYAFSFAGIYDEDEAERIAASPPAPSSRYIEHDPEPNPDAPAESAHEDEPNPDASVPASQGHAPLKIEELRSDFLTALHESRSADSCKEVWDEFIEPVKLQLPEADFRDLSRIYRNALGTFGG